MERCTWTLGNHEVMVMTGDLRYVSAAEFAAFADDESAADREDLYAQYRRYNTGGDEATVRATFDEQFPLGFAALRKAYSLDGHLGRWLIQQPFVIKVNDKVYMHGGIADSATGKSIKELNKTLQGELKTFLSSMDTLYEAGVMPRHVSYHDRLGFLNARVEEFVAANPKDRAPWFAEVQQVFEAQEAFVFSSDSPNWYRGTATCHPLSESFNTERFPQACWRQTAGDGSHTYPWRSTVTYGRLGHTTRYRHVESRLQGPGIRAYLQ